MTRPTATHSKTKTKHVYSDDLLPINELYVIRIYEKGNEKWKENKRNNMYKIRTEFIYYWLPSCLEKNKAPIERYETISWLLGELPWKEITLRALNDKIESNHSQNQRGNEKKKHTHTSNLIVRGSIRNVFHSIFSMNGRKTKISLENKSKSPRERREIYENISNAHVVRHWAREHKQRRK